MRLDRGDGRVSALTMAIDKANPGRLYLRGNAGAGSQTVLDAAVAMLAASPQLVLDIGDVTAAGSRLVGLLNELARHAASLKKTVILEVPADAAAWLSSAKLRPEIRVERTHILEAAAKRPAPSSVVDAAADGIARHQGRGHIASYGESRRCATVGCSTTLSRYNSDTLCSLHTLAVR